MRQKACTKCKIVKSLTKFNDDRRHKDGKQSQCKTCVLTGMKERNRINPIYKKGGYHRKENKKLNNARLKYRYGITAKEYKEIFEAQKGVCAICGKSQNPKHRWLLGVDHDHKTNQVRGLLCHKCNVILGLCNENPNILTNAISYLRSI